MKTNNFYKIFAGLTLGTILSGPMASTAVAKDLESITKEYTDPVKSNKEKQISYDPIKSQRGLQAAKVKYETDAFVVYEFGFNSDLKKAINNSKKPKLYSTDPKTRVTFSPDTTSALVYYSKKNFDETGKGKTIGITIRDGANIGVCDPKGLGYVNNHLPSIYWSPTHLFNEKEEKIENKKEEKTEIKETQKEIKSINNFSIENKIIVNNYDKRNSKKNKMRLGIDAIGTSKKELFVGGFVQAPIKNNLFLGFYGKTDLIKKNESITQDYTFKEKISNNLNLESDGFNKTEIKEINSFEGGIIGSYILDKFGVDVSVGIGKKTNTEDLLKKGFDRIVDNSGNIINEKPFCVEDKKEIDYTNFVGRISINYYPTKNIVVGLEGKINDKSEISAGIKTAITIGGKKRK